MNRRRLALGLVLAAGMARADASRWIWLLPGGGQFMLGETAEGWTVAGGTAALGGWAWWAQVHKGDGELNAPLLYAQQWYVGGFYAAYRELRLRAGDTARLDPTKVAHLATAPVNPSVVLSPWVLGFAAAGGALNWWLARAASDRGNERGITRVAYLGGTFDRNQGRAAAGAYWAGISYGAGEAEEMLFRGAIQSDWEASWGTVPGWLAASAVFGLAHVTSVTSAAAWENAGFAAVAGLYLGWRFRANGYRLAESIASHVWFDVAAGVVTWLEDPKDNPLGARVTFGL